MNGALHTYVDVLLPVAVPNLYTYHIPKNINPVTVQPGLRVSIQFGKRKLFTALVVHVHNTPPKEYKTKEILAVLDDVPVVRPWQFKFWNWVASYYMCTNGEVFTAAVPTGLRPEGQTRLYINNIPDEGVSLSPSEEHIYYAIDNNPGITIEQLQLSSERKQIMPTLRALQQQEIICFEESIRERVRPKIIEEITLHQELQNEASINELLNKLEKKAPKQSAAFLTYLQLCGYLNKRTFDAVEKTLLQKKSNANHQAIKALTDKNIFLISEKEVTRLVNDSIEVKELFELNTYQNKATSEIKSHFEKGEVTLLHGITSSGKTEIYIHLIKEQLEAGKQVLYLLPEIALTTQIINRLKNVFGNKVAVYHSRFNSAERVEIWNNLLGIKPAESSNYQVLLGVRSSLFLPFKNLGLIICDEEHENSYKQFSPAPRYHARDAAVVLANIHKANILLGTATPSLETYYNVKTKKYALVELFHRHLDIQLPEIHLINVREARRKKQMSSNFSPQLIEAVQKALNSQEQVILFQNRRGFSPYLECHECAWIPTCVHCDVSLTYHKGINKLVCHYCGFSLNSVTQCKACGSTNVKTRGFGTQKVEDDIKMIFPEARVERMDMDSTRKKKSFEQIITNFANEEIDILIGTQMVSKGLDFDNVSVVGILNADNMLNYPDFRAFERSFQLMSQVSGRAGRKKRRGQVYIQTSDPANSVLQQVINNDYSTFFNEQFAERNRFRYPPFYRLINLSLKHKQLPVLNKAAYLLTKELRNRFGNRVLGPEAPVISRIQNWHIKQVLIKLEKNQEVAKHKSSILELIQWLKTQEGFSTLQVIPDVDFF